MKGRVAAVLATVLAVTVLQGCERDPYPLTQCVNGAPVIERIRDVAPPNC